MMNPRNTFRAVCRRIYESRNARVFFGDQKTFALLKMVCNRIARRMCHHAHRTRQARRMKTELHGTVRACRLHLPNVFGFVGFIEGETRVEITRLRGANGHASGTVLPELGWSVENQPT